MKSKLSQKAHRDSRIKLWHIPPRSPDLNPIEKFWAWLKKRLRKRDLQDFALGRPALGKMAYASRVRNYCYSAAGTRQARNVVLGLRRVCLEVRRENGGPTSGMCVCVFACARRKTKKTRTRQPSTSGFLFHRSPSSRAVSKVLV